MRSFGNVHIKELQNIPRLLPRQECQYRFLSLLAAQSGQPLACLWACVRLGYLLYRGRQGLQADSKDMCDLGDRLMCLELQQRRCRDLAGRGL